MGELAVYSLRSRRANLARGKPKASLFERSPSRIKPAERASEYSPGRAAGEQRQRHHPQAPEGGGPFARSHGAFVGTMSRSAFRLGRPRVAGLEIGWGLSFLGLASLARG